MKYPQELLDDAQAIATTLDQQLSLLAPESDLAQELRFMKAQMVEAQMLPPEETVTTTLRMMPRQLDIDLSLPL